MKKKVVTADELSKARDFERALRSVPGDARPSAKRLEAAVFVKRRAARVGEDLDGLTAMFNENGMTPAATAAALAGDHRARCAMLASHLAALATAPEATAEDEDYARAAWELFLVRRLGDAERPSERRQRFMRELDRYARARERGQVELLQSFDRPRRELPALRQQLDALADAWMENKPGRRKGGAAGKYEQLSALFEGTDMEAKPKTWENEAGEIGLPSTSTAPA